MKQIKNGPPARPEKNEVSPAVVNRLPRYFRYLRELIRQGRSRISSGELSEMMNVTASQIRQDLNCFGGFGQQGYGYNVNYLYAKISEILGVGEGYTAIVVGIGNLGRALVHNPMFEKRGVDVVGLFDSDPAKVGTVIDELPVRDMKDLESFLEQTRVDMAVLTLPKDAADEVADRLAAAGVPGIWNFTGRELDRRLPHTVIESVHLGDSLMRLCFGLREGGKGEE